MTSRQHPYGYGYGSGYGSAGWRPDVSAETFRRGPGVSAETFPLPWDGLGGPERLTALLDARDPATGLPSAAVLLARVGRILGSACEPGWALGLVALRLERSPGSPPLEVPSEQILCTAAGALWAELRFDDIVARVDSRTFVVAALLLEGDAEGRALAPHLEAAVRAVVALAAPPAAGPAWTVHAADVLVPLPCDGQADLLVRQVVEVARG